MKKKFIAATMVALAAAGAYMGAGTLTRSTELSELQLANIEALADDSEQSGNKTCYDEIKAKDGCQVRYCPVCEYVPGVASQFSPGSMCK